MPYSEEDRLTTLEIRKQASPQQLADEMKEAVLAASAMGVFTKMETCHNTRRCCWTGQMEDGRRGPASENERMFRWQGAPDLRVPLADTVIRRLMLIRAGVVNRGDVRIAPRRGQSDQATGQDMPAVWQGVMEYFLDILSSRVSSALDLFNVCTEEFGYCGLLPDWKKKQRMELKKMSFQNLTDALLQKLQMDMMQAAQDAGQEPDAVLTPDVEELLTQTVSVMLEELLQADGPVSAEQIALVKLVDPAINDSESRRVIAAFRKASGDEVEYHAPRDDGGIPDLKVLIPWVNFIHPHDMTGDGKTDWFCIPDYLTETDLNERARSEKWNKPALAKLKETQKNKLFHTLYSTGGIRLQGWLANGVGVGLTASEQAMDKCPRWLVFYQFRKVTDRNGLPRVIKCVFNPSMTEENDLLMWQETDHVDIPLIVETAEPSAFALLSRGACDIIVDKQNFVKDSLDNEGARGQLGSNPPLLRGAKDHVGIKPGKEMFARRSGNSFEGSEFLPVPPVDQGTFKMVELVERAVNRYYFDSEDTPEESRRMFHEWVTFRAVRIYRELLRMIWKTVQENVENVQVSSIAGRLINLSASRDQLQGEADIQIGVHLDGYGDEAAEKFIKVYGQMVQNDRAGNIDSNEGMQIMGSLLSPMYARRLIMPASAAAGKIKDDQENRITKILAGIPVEYSDVVSAPGMRTEVMQQWSQMPGNVQRAMADPTVATMMQKEMRFLQFQEQQQTTNKQTGRTGVKPNTPEEMAAA